MLSKDPAAKTQKSSSLSGSQAGAAAAADPNPRAVIETASTGNGTPPPDQGGSDRPPGVSDLDYLA